MAFETVRHVIESELGGRSKQLLEHMEPNPSAAASVGQVHRSWLPGGRPVAVKVRYPGIEDAFAADFRPAAVGTGLASLFYPGAEITGFVREAREGFLAECDYIREAASQSRFRTIYHGHPTIEIPEVHPA